MKIQKDYTSDNESLTRLGGLILSPSAGRFDRLKVSSRVERLRILSEVEGQGVLYAAPKENLLHYAQAVKEIGKY